MALPNVQRVTFDQCELGLVSAVQKLPMRKRTCILTNSDAVFQAFRGKFCKEGHMHQTIEGSEGGQKRSTAAQHYPPQMVELLASAFIAEERRA